jgi:hypothetical protein
MLIHLLLTDHSFKKQPISRPFVNVDGTAHLQFNVADAMRLCYTMR